MRKSRPGEVVCQCDAYEFPHRMTGGRCSGRHIAEGHFFGSNCRDCNYLDATCGYRSCQILDGAEAITQCPEWQDVIRTNEIRLYGPKYFHF